MTSIRLQETGEEKRQAADAQKDEDEGRTRNGKRPLEARCGMLGRMMEQKEIDRVKTMAVLCKAGRGHRTLQDLKNDPAVEE